MITLPPLDALDGLRHGFFTRRGGVSEGLYGSLNVGFGSDDDPERVVENRARCAGRLDRPAEALATLYQIHSNRVVEVEAPWPRGEAPQADGMATRTPGVVLGILTADCAPVLFADPEARVIGAAHAGWKGAIGGVLEETVAAMARLGARPERIVAALGPCIGPASYEVSQPFVETFLTQSPANERFFAPGRRPGHAQFDLPAFVVDRLSRMRLGAVVDAGLDTCPDEERFFSYRRTTLRGEPDYGRQLSAIVLEP